MIWAWGKTHQAMALLAAADNVCKRIEPGQRRYFLVVCPTSVIYHWQEKLQRFLPNLRVKTFYGAQRKLEHCLAEGDLILTSYGVLRMERENLAEIYFDIVIFDEIQMAKNHQSQVHAAVGLLQAKMRLGLTGTPLENNLRELKALFDLVLPDYMPSESRYRRIFVHPIEKQGDNVAKQLLNRYIKPFLLRRRKTEVLQDLPEKTEELAYCELLADQSSLYQKVLTQSREQMVADLKEDSKKVEYMHIFALLSKLKQICDHPAVYHKKPSDYSQYLSGKWVLFVELLTQARDSSQKVVVFSQYLDMLNIIEAFLKKEKIGYASIRGETVKRGEELQRFHEDPHCEVFVGSLGAVGMGVDLTAASVVIHYDRWWNAARENQATDRVHRIGQQKGVQVFKLVTKKTLEEGINRIIEKKAALFADVIVDTDGFKSFSREELIELLQFAV